MLKLIKTSLPTIVLFIGFGLVASSAATSPNLNADVLYGCVTPVNGNLTRVSTTPPTCPKNTSLITWGAKGAQGNAGAQGPAGIQGIKGDKGDTGSQGHEGQQGVHGLQGFTGMTGATGDQGPHGEIGSKGEQGDAGPKGDAGPQGAAGPSDLYVFSGVVEQCGYNSAGNIMASMTLPAGSYWLDVFSTYYANYSPVTPPYISLPNKSVSLMTGDYWGSTATSVTGFTFATLSESTTVSIRCSDRANYNLQKFTALKVADIHQISN